MTAGRIEFVTYGIGKELKQKHGGQPYGPSNSISNPFAFEVPRGKNAEGCRNDQHGNRHKKPTTRASDGLSPSSIYVLFESGERASPSPLPGKEGLGVGTAEALGGFQ